MQDYPTSSDAKLLVDIDGPLGAHDPAREALHSHLAAVAAEQQEELGGSGGYIWQLVGAAKEWIDANIPADIATRKAGQAAAAAAAPATTHSGATQTAAGTVAAASEAAAAGVGSSGVVPWWEKDEVDVQLVAKATAEAAAAHWASWSVNSEDNPWGADDDAAAAAGATPAGANGGSSSSSAEALASAGDGVRGRWDYVIGLVGKPSAGKSTFWNAVCGACRGPISAHQVQLLQSRVDTD